MSMLTSRGGITSVFVEGLINATAQLDAKDELIAKLEAENAVLRTALQDIANSATTIGSDGWCGDIASATLAYLEERK